MTLTRVHAETILVKRCGALLSAAGLAVTVAGSNADLDDPLGYALRKLGHTVADVTAVTSDEVGAVGTDEVDEFLDLAELRTLETCHTHVLDLVTLVVGSRKEDLSDLAAALEAKIGRLQERLRAEYGWGLSQLEAGVLALDFAENSEDS